jgi:hypothetical protein
MRNKFLQLLNDLGGKVEKAVFENICDEKGLFEDISEALAVSREKRRLMSLSLSQPKIVFQDQKFKSVIEINSKEGEPEYLLLTADNLQDMLKKYPEEIISSMQKDEKSAQDRASVQQLKSWESRKQWQLLLPLTGLTDVSGAETQGEGDSPPEQDFMKRLKEYEAEIKHHSDDEYIRPGQYEGDFVWPRYKMVIEMDSYEYHFKSKRLYRGTADRDFYYLERGYNLEQVHARWLMEHGAGPVAKRVVDKIRKNYKLAEGWETA